MIIQRIIEPDTPLTEEQKKMIKDMETRPITPDEDCPELTEEQLADFKRISAEKREERCKQTVTIRLSPQALAKAKSLGKGYTSVLSRILENALNDTETIRNNL